jgi:hypothetical protein
MAKNPAQKHCIEITKRFRAQAWLAYITFNHAQKIRAEPDTFLAVP